MERKVRKNISYQFNDEIAVRKAKEFHYPIVLMDLEVRGYYVLTLTSKMPVMDGRAATQELKSTLEYKDTPIIAFTAHVLTDDEKTALKEEYGFSDFLIKPVSGKDLKKLLNKVWVS
jgi:two-component system sensor histidine kinase BarA